VTVAGLAKGAWDGIRSAVKAEANINAVPGIQKDLANLADSQAETQQMIREGFARVDAGIRQIDGRVTALEKQRNCAMREEGQYE